MKKHIYRLIQLLKSFAAAVLNRVSLMTNYMFFDRCTFRKIQNAVLDMPRSNGTRFYRRFDIRVGIIADPFVLQNYDPVCNLVRLTPSNWRDQLQKLDCLLVTSAWRGEKGEWIGLSHRDSALRMELLSLMDTARKFGIPVLFYSKEDPPNFDVFKVYAEKADHIFTSARECIPRYRELFPEAKIHELCFAVNPMLHNPIGSSREKLDEGVLFAGSWMTKYAKRTEDMINMISFFEKRDIPIHIADRNFHRGNFRYQYPIRYMKYIVGSFSYGELAACYKLFPWSMNLNSVTESETMFAMRVYDALASGASVVSNLSIGLRRLFPEVYILQDDSKIKCFEMDSDAKRYRNKLSGIRRVFGYGTVFERMEHMLFCAELIPSLRRSPSIGVILADNMDISSVEQLQKMFEKQSFCNRILVKTQDDPHLLDKCDMLTIWGPNREYGKYYLEDLANGFKYTDCDYIAKPLENEREFEYTSRLNDKYAALFWAEKFSLAYLKTLPEGIVSLENGFLSDRDSYRLIK